MRQKQAIGPLSLLDRLIAMRDQDARLRDLLRDPEEEYAGGWWACVPRAFNDALDIRQTPRKKRKVWTQGFRFSFKAGDVLYDSREAYRSPWSSALAGIRFCLRIRQAASADVQLDDDGFARFSGLVCFEIMRPNSARTKLAARGDYTLSQDDFVRFLIAGPDQELRRLLLE